MRWRNVLTPGQSLAIAFLSVVVIGAVGCGSNATLPTPPKDTVSFPSASTRAWLQQYGSGTTVQRGDIAYGVATDPQGDVFLLDQTVGAFPGFSNPGNAPEFAVVKFNSSGARVWTQQLGTGQGDYPYAIATDSLGDIIVVGSTNGAFPGFTNPNRYSEGVVIKLDPSGQIVWIQQSPSSGPNRVTTVAVDPQNNVIVGGNIPGSRGSTIIGGYVSKLNGANGQTLWTKGTNGNGPYYLVSGVAADAQGSVFAVGQFPGSNTSGGSTVYQAAKFNGVTGQVLWTQVSATTNGIPSYTAIAVAPAGNVFLGGINNTSGYNQCAIAKLANADGSTAWTQSFGATQSCIPGAIASDTAGNVLLTGDVNGSFSTTSTTTAASFQQDIFLAKLNSAGQGVWVQQFGTGDDNPIVQNGTVALTFVATDSQNRVDIGGTTQGAFSGFNNPKGINQLFATQFAP